MKLKISNSMHFSHRALFSAFLLTLATSASAAPGELSDVPLYTRGGAEPNIMFVLDSSGSMYQVVLPAEEYDPDASIPCSNSISENTYTYRRNGRTRTDSFEVNYRVHQDTGAVEFKRVAPMDSSESDANWRAWDSSGNCFKDDVTFDVRFYADGEVGSYYETGNHQDYSYLNLHNSGSNGDRPRQTGHFLNWFFSREIGGSYVADHFLEVDGTTVRRSKLGVDRRTDIMKNSASDLISDLSDVRVGLMQFDPEGEANGGGMLQGLTSINDETKLSLISAISEVSANGGTPLGETFEDVGRYFISGYDDQELAYKKKNWDDSITTASKRGDEIFSSEPDWGDVSKPVSGVDGAAIQYYCQKSFMVALTDGDPTSDGDVDGDLSEFDYACEGVSGCTTGNNDSMDDVVKALYDIDLRPDLKEPNQTPVKNNIASYMIGFANSNLSNSEVLINSGCFGSGHHEGDGSCDSGSSSDYVYSANNASELKVTFNRIINKVHAIVGSSSSVAFNSTSLETGSALYAAKFDSGDWSGELSALTINSDGSISSTSSWEAADILDQGDDVSGRILLTYKDGGGVPFTTVDTALDFDGAESDTELDLKINTSTGSKVEDDLAAERLAYLRGDRSNEGGSVDQFRARSSRLGDIVNSTPVYVGAPAGSWDRADFPESDSYAQFKSDKSSRTPMVYVGANDGFLHGFNASATGANAGKELIGYSPAVLTSSEEGLGLHALTSQLYQHKYYVDGTPTVVDAYIESGDTAAWKSILVGGLGGGGKGYFALDVTNPSLFSEDNAGDIVLWEFTSSSNENLGYTFSRPQIGRMSNGKWAAVFGNGYDSETGDAGLFIVYLDGSGHVYLPTNIGTQAIKNGLSTPAIVDADLNGTIDRIYAGDLFGNMWVFDVETDEKWSAGAQSGTVIKLFSSGQPITGAPLVARNTANESGAVPNLLVTFGTGQYLTGADTADASAGGFYAVSDNGQTGLTANNLEIRTLGERTVEGVTHRTLSGNAIDWSSKAGWYIPLQTGVNTDGGERVVTRPDLLRNILFFNTLIPTGEVCSAGGYGWLMSVDVRTGLAPEKYAIYDGNGDGTIDSADMGLIGSMVSEGIPNKPGFLGGKRQYTSTSAGTINERDINVGGGEREGRLSWEEIRPK
ncbi:pilus assembly protein [Microbulbifer aggregans]|uniref:pilus assembly protein n=1 Tax=Microbulbifer aggregans TaxID=1769779 RepID=UPI001CFC8B36|nr:PilC/PilY family type IV pilus protein [Microbulbifer aggregans]